MSVIGDAVAAVRLYEAGIISKNEARIMANVVRPIVVPDGHIIAWSCPAGECKCMKPPEEAA